MWWNYDVHKSRVSQIKSTGGGGGGGGAILAECPITADFVSKKLGDMGGQGVVKGSRGGSPPVHPLLGETLNSRVRSVKFEMVKIGKQK